MRGNVRLDFLAAQERYESVLADTFRRFGPRVVDLGYANAYDGPDPRVLAALREALDDDRDLSFQYTPYGGNTVTRRLIATRIAGETGLPLNYRDVVLTPGAMAALNCVFRTVFEDGGRCLVLTPCWIDYPLYLDNLGIPFDFVPLADEKHLDLEALSAAITPDTRAVIFSQPGCPTGVVMNDGELRELAALLAAKEAASGGRIYVIGDEVHRDVAWGERPLPSVLGYHPRSLSIYSFGKSLFLQGQRIGYIAVSPAMPERNGLRTRLTQLMRAMGFCTPTNLMQRAVRGLLDYRPPLETVAERQKLARARLAEYGYSVVDGGATFFVYAKSPIEDEFEFIERLAARGVLVLPSTIFHEPGYFRISLTARDDALQSGLPAFQEVL